MDPAPAPSILVVEDDPVLKNLLGHTLGGRYQALHASDGALALALLDTQPPALILLDLMLPGLDGFGVLSAVRSRTDALAKVPIVVVSNLGAKADRDRARSLGADDYLVKAEVSVEEIVACIDRLLGGKAPAGAA